MVNFFCNKRPKKAPPYYPSVEHYIGVIKNPLITDYDIGAKKE
jgi:hypothetical protein